MFIVTKPNINFWPPHKFQSKIILRQKIWGPKKFEISKVKKKLSMKKNIGSKKFWLQKYFGSKYFECKHFFVQKNFGSRIFGQEKFLIPEIYLVRKNLGPEKIMGPEKVLGPEKV